MNGQFELGAVSPRRYFFGLATVLGLVFALVGERDEGQGLFTYLLIWQLQTWLPMLLLVTSHILLSHWAWFEARNRWLQLALSGLAGVLLFSPLNMLLDLWLEREYAAMPSLPAVWLQELGNTAPPVVVCWLAINAPWLLGFRLQRRGSEQADEIGPDAIDGPPEQDSPRFLELLPDNLHGELIYLKAELHYLQVVTEEGSTLILYNFGDAVAELAGSQGFQCHRSYWVNPDKVVSFRRQGRQGRLLLSDGSEVPVSRANVKTSAGLFPAT